MESLSSNNNNNIDKEEGELSDDDDSGIQERSITIDTQDVGRSRRSNVDAGHCRNVKRCRSRSLLRNQKFDDPRRYSHKSPAGGCRKNDDMYHNLQQELLERRKSTSSGLQRNVSPQEKKVSSEMRAASLQNGAPSRNIMFPLRKRILPSKKRAHSSQDRIFPSEKRVLPFKKIALSSQTFKDTQDELKKLEQEQKEIKRQLKLLEEEEQRMEEDENEIQSSGYDSLLDVFENLNKETDDEKENLPVPKAHSGPPFVNKDLIDPANSLNTFNGLTASEKMPTTFSFSSDKETTAISIVTPNQIPVHYSSCRENNTRILPHVRGKPYVNNRSIDTKFDFGVSTGSISTPKPKKAYGTDRHCSGGASFCLPSSKKLKTSSPAVIPVFKNGPEYLLINGKEHIGSYDSDEEDVESLRVRLLEDVKEKRKSVAEWPISEIVAPVHESALSDSSFVIVDGDDLPVEQQDIVSASPAVLTVSQEDSNNVNLCQDSSQHLNDLPVEQQDIVRVSPAVLTVSQEDSNNVNLCQDSSQHLNDLQEQLSLVKLCKMKLTAEDWNHKAQPQRIQQPFTCSLSSFVSTANLQLYLNTASTSALKTPRMSLEEIAQVTVPKSPVFPHEVVNICIQKESQCITSSLESVDAEADIKCLNKPSISSQKNIQKSACSSDSYESRPSIKPVALSSVTEYLSKIDPEEYCAKQSEAVDKNIPFSQSDADGAVSQASLSPVSGQETHLTSDLIISQLEIQTSSLKCCPSKKTRKMIGFATSSSYLLNPAVMTASSASHSSQINKMSVTKGRPLLTESAEECTPVKYMAQLSPTGSAADQSAAGSAAQLFPLECSAHQSPAGSTTQITASEFIVQLSTTEPAAHISPAESTSQLNPAESRVQISTIESTDQISTIESTAQQSTAQLPFVQSTTQLSPAKLVSSLSISQMALTRSTALVSSAACHVTSDLPVGQSSNSYSSSSAAFSSHPHKVPRKYKKHFRLPVHPQVIIPLSPCSDSNDDDDQRKTQTLEVTDSMKPLHTLEDQNTTKPDHVERILNEAERTSQMLRDSEQKLASLEELMQTHQREVQLLTEKEADIQKAVQQKEKELDHLRSQLIPLRQQITNRNTVVILYKSDIEKTQKEVQRFGKWKDQYQANKTRSELSASAADTTTVTSLSARQSQVSSADRTEQRAQERQKLLEREKQIKETLEKLRKNVLKTGTRKLPFVSKRLRNAQSIRNLLKINTAVGNTHILPQ